MGGYAYAGNNPVVHSDPSGLRIDPDGKASDAAAVGDLDFARRRSAQAAREGSSGSGGATRKHVVALTPHVLLRDDDPYYPKLYKALHPDVPDGKPLVKLKNEESIWRWVWSSKGMCPKALQDLLGGGNGSYLFPTNYHKATHVNGRVMGIMIGSGTRKDGFVRRLNDPDSMRGATEEEVNALARSSGLQSAPMKPSRSVCQCGHADGSPRVCLSGLLASDAGTCDLAAADELTDRAGHRRETRFRDNHLVSHPEVATDRDLAGPLRKEPAHLVHGEDCPGPAGPASSVARIGTPVRVGTSEGWKS